MNAQMQEATKTMIGWLSNEHELGKAPTKIECVKEFDLYDLHYYVFRYKKGIFGDGFYQSFWGYDADGEICELIVPMVNPDIIDEMDIE